MTETYPSTVDARAGSGWRSILPIHPAAELFPLMTLDELRVLGKDIKANGLTSPIAIKSAKDASGWLYWLLDGRNRLDAMEAVGVPARLELTDGQCCVIMHADTDHGWSDASVIESDPYAYVISTNIHRRHLTAEDKRKIIANLLKAQPEKSDRQIAETVKASPTTVGTVRAEMESTVQIGQLPKRIGKDGKARKQPTTKATGETSQDHRPSATRSGNKPPKVDKEERFQHALAQLHERNEDQQDALRGLREDKRALEIKVLALESEVSDLKRENEHLKAALKLVKAPPAAPDDGLDIPAFLRREVASSAIGGGAA